MVTACRRRGWKTGDEQMTGEAVKQRVREYMRSWEMTEPGDGILAGCREAPIPSAFFSCWTS